MITVSAPKIKVEGLGASVLAMDSRVEGVRVFPFSRLTSVLEGVGSRQGPTTCFITINDDGDVLSLVDGTRTQQSTKRI